jgi:hypothetical protein
MLPSSPKIIEQPPLTIYIFQTLMNKQQAPHGDEDSDSEDAIPQDTPTDSYSIVPRSGLTRKADERLLLVRQWHAMLQHPTDIADNEFETFLQYCTEFFLSGE